MIKIKKLIPLFLIIILIFSGIKFISYINYQEKHSYNLQEIEDNNYAIYYSVVSNIPAKNYDVIIVCYKDQIHKICGRVNIQQTNGRPCVEIITKPHINNANEIIVSIPKGGIKIINSVGLK